jgi:hypothetical protein
VVKLWSASVGLLAMGCSSTIASPTSQHGADPFSQTPSNSPAAQAGAGSPAQTASCPAQGLIPMPVRRLSHVEYDRTVRALFPEIDVPKAEFSADLSVHGFENNAAALNPSPMLLEQYAAAASRIAELAAAAPEKFLGCASGARDLACGQEFIRSFGRRAFRRPLTADEQARYEMLFAQQMGEISFNAALELTLEAFLQSPQFLYRIEAGDPGENADTAVRLDGYAMASRLSYLLWQSMPDDALLDAAEQGSLQTSEGIADQARRMLQSPQAVQAMVDFHRQWLGFDRVLSENKDPDLFPDWNDSLRDAMREESDRFVAQIFGPQGSATIRDLLLSTTSFVNGPLGALYGVPVAGDDWQTVELPSAERAGILTRANFLAGEAHSTNGSPPLRGVAVLDRVLCSRPPAPPANIDATAPVSDPNVVRTNRQLFEERNGVAQCQVCHRGINGIGYGFEAYDSIGRFRALDRGMNVDASGELIGTDVDGPYSGAIELSQRLADSRQVAECAAKNWYRYAFARSEDSADACMLDYVYQAMDESAGDVRELLVRMVTSYPFTYRAAITQ